MSYDTETKNAEWVYEILNESTLENTWKEHMSFGRNELENTDYQQGHLAAAANHRTLAGSPPWLFSARSPVPSRSPLPILLCSRSAPSLDFSGRCLRTFRRRSALLALVKPD
ncbi:hypothetical protein G5714_003913 [Onychostoma macrolepis]|uniref:Uncharacterized protein n=1 Tax=Onychostoma macrolepis TaxID=369639 RepID=A0A7J6DC41_9TELE|nr:hypothetical protein G5714_003913 [Onychostoma macrolepis]